MQERLVGYGLWEGWERKTTHPPLPRREAGQGASPGCERHRHADKELRAFLLPLLQESCCLPGGGGPGMCTGNKWGTEWGEAPRVEVWEWQQAPQTANW